MGKGLEESDVHSTTSFEIRSYEYSNPYEKKEFTDEGYWSIDKRKFQSNKQVDDLLNNPRKVLLVERGERGGSTTASKGAQLKTFLGMII